MPISPFKKLTAFLFSGMLLLSSCGAPIASLLAQGKPTTEVGHLPQEGTLEQQSVLSWLIKQGVKKVGKEQLKEALEKSVREPLRKFAADKEAKEILQEADALFSVLNPDPSAADLIGFVPVVGDVFDAVKFAQSSAQFKAAFKKLDVLHNRAKSYLAKRKPAPAKAIGDAMRDYKLWERQIGNKKIRIIERSMKHILTRHHPKYWDGKVGASGQAFFDDKMTVEEVQQAIHTVLRQNQAILDKTDRTAPITGTYKGVTYRLGFIEGQVSNVHMFHPVY